MHSANFIQVSSSGSVHSHDQLSLWALKDVSNLDGQEFDLVRGGQRVVSGVSGAQVQLLFNELGRTLNSSSNNRVEVTRSLSR